jgi:hypothetical protein
VLNNRKRDDFFIAQAIKKSLRQLQPKEKIFTAEPAEPSIPEDELHEAFYPYFILSASSRISAV